MSVKGGRLYRYTRKAHFAYMNLINIKYAFAPTPTVGQAMAAWRESVITSIHHTISTVKKMLRYHICNPAAQNFF